MDFAQLCTAETFLLWIGRKLLSINHENIFTTRGLPQEKNKKQKKKKRLHAAKERDIQMAKSGVRNSSNPAAELSLKQRD